MKQYLLVLLLLVAACTQTQAPITSFEECMEAGNPVMESYPRQCRANDETFIEEVPPLPFPEVEEKPQEFKVATTCTQEQKESQICTREYRPVCGLVDNGVRCVTAPCPSMDAKTFGNKCEACAGQAEQYYEGACEDQYFVVCKDTVTGFDPVEHAKANNGICVNVCPNNFDPYMTQIGVEVCIEQYGEEEITQWQTCTESSNSCNCVKAYETTANEQIEDPQYRCVPERYANRLLFRGGLDRLDENGQGSVMIA